MGRVDALRWRKEAADRLERIHDAMRKLSEATTSIEGRACYLDLYRRSDIREHQGTSCMSIRWRSMGRHRHTTWDELVESVMRHLPSTVQEWYEAANQEAALLNIQERALRHTVRCADEAIAMLSQ
jgi:hypothetical protein